MCGLRRVVLQVPIYLIIAIVWTISDLSVIRIFGRPDAESKSRIGSVMPVEDAGVDEARSGDGTVARLRSADPVFKRT